MLHGGAGRSLSGGKSLIGKSAAGSRLRHGIGEALGCGNRFVKVHGLIGARAPGHHGSNF